MEIVVHYKEGWQEFLDVHYFLGVFVYFVSLVYFVSGFHLLAQAVMIFRSFVIHVVDQRDILKLIVVDLIK